MGALCKQQNTLMYFDAIQDTLNFIFLEITN